MSDFSCDLPLESQLEVFHPMMVDVIKKVTLQFSQSIKVDLSSSNWWLIQDVRTKADLSRPHTLETLWQDFQQYFQQKKDLYLFFEEPILGIVAKKAQFWVFFEPRMAASYFQRQTERPKNFNRTGIKKFPPLALVPGLTQKVHALTRVKEGRAMNNLKKLEELITVADAYLPTEAAQYFTGTIRKILVLFTLTEVQLLKKDITNAGVSPLLLEKRLEAIFRVCVRLYSIKNNDQEREVLRKLVSPKIIIRRKALEVVERRLSKDVG
ncbi:MAG: hypothetical protein COB67_12065 [SAR324 cluster bacterium]|uniref:Uncharacterized protein n=1 Tax=SAR324 cluster bacterium TaxID=2024889 RepID=A0A2A4SRR8_9DELT|nr:MAG: hypothetical protein COB67_12065 [SAR324 cluster bacterium]